MEANVKLGSDFLHKQSPKLVQLFRSVGIMTPFFQSIQELPVV